MVWRGWPLTLVIIAAALVVSFILWQLGIFFFFLPIIFLPLLGLKFRTEKIPVCKRCGSKSGTKYCPNCGAKMKKR